MMTRILSALLLLAVGFISCRQLTLEERAERIHRRILTLDSHNDTPLHFPQSEYDILRDNPNVCVDVPKMEKGGLDGAFFAAYVRQGLRDSLAHLAAIAKVTGIIKDIHGAVDAHPEKLMLALTPADGYTAKRSGRRAVYIGVENGYGIGTELDMLDRYYGMGVRYMTLSHTRNNEVCDSSTDHPEHGGLTDFGRDVVRRMNRLGMMVDVSHVSEASAFQAIELSEVPVIASHSCARALCDISRNMSDSLLCALAAKGGVMQLCILSDYVRKAKPNPQFDSAMQAMRERYAVLGKLTDEQRRRQQEEYDEILDTYPPDLATVAEAVDHIDHVVELTGIDHVGIGTDFDGGGQLQDCRNASQLKNITIELLRRGYSDRDIEKIWAGNLLRVMRVVQAYAAGKQAEACG